jgi:hypothetical protein
MRPRRSRSSNPATAWRRTFILIPAIVVTALAAAQSASAATSLVGEALSSTAGRTSNGSTSCASTSPSGHASFSVSGQATGPYPGTFVASGSAWAYGRQQFGAANASETATFTITSGATTITGTLRPTRSFAGVGYYCPTFAIYRLPITYTAVIDGQPSTGTGLAGGSFNTSPAPQNLPSVNASFTTSGPGQLPSPAPAVSTGSAVNVGPDAATVWGTVNSNAEAATYHFDYGTSTNYTSQTISEPILNSTPTSVDARLTGLSPNTVYHYRLEATDAWGTNYGADQTFTTTTT